MPKVLVVDDAAIVREPITEALRASGYEVYAAASGREAMSLLQTQHPDMVLLDLHLPEVDGLRVLQSIRTNMATKSLPVVVLTQEEKRDFIVQAAKLGVQGYILKSKFSMRDMLSRVQRAVGAGVGAAEQSSASGNSPATTAPPASTNPQARAIDPSTKTVPGPSPAPHATAPTGPVSVNIRNTNQSAGSTQSQQAQTQEISIPHLLTRDKAIERAEKALAAKTVSGVVAQVIALTTSPAGDASQLAGLIGRDPVLSARVLQAANSAYYAAKRGVVSTVEDAVKQIGFTAVCNIASTIGILDAMPQASEDGFNSIRCLQHSLAVAQLCERFAMLAKEADQAKEKDKGLAGKAYLVGLCHDLAEILFHSQFSKEYQQVLELQQKTGRRRDELEREVLGLTQSDLMTIILRCLSLPDAVRQPIEALRTSSQDQGGRVQPGDLGRILQEANFYANGMFLAADTASGIAPLRRSECQALLGNADPPALDNEKFRSGVFSLTLLMARLSRNEEAELAKPLLPRSDAKVWLARDPAFSALCPIAAALAAAASVDVHERLPKAEEFSNYRGLVVVSAQQNTSNFAATDVQAIATKMAEPNRQILWITGKLDAAQPHDSTDSDASMSQDQSIITPEHWPISLHRIGQFVGKL
jgi:CheY-like chemotaxis protein/HD-like signal output (HDOD) protein